MGKMTLTVLYRAMKAAEAAWKSAQASAVKDLPNGAPVAMGDGATGTVVRGTSRTASIDKAREILKPAQLKAIRAESVSLALLDAAVAAGKITQAQADEIAPASPRAAYIRVTLH
jgi:hypothetical protein